MIWYCLQVSFSFARVSIKPSIDDVLTLGKNDKLDLVSIEVTPFLKNKPPVTNLLENDIINEDSVITQTLFGGEFEFKVLKEYNLRIKQGDVIWCSRSIIAGR